MSDAKLTAEEKPETAEHVARAEGRVSRAERHLLDVTGRYLFPRGDTPREQLKEALREAWYQRNYALWEVDNAKRAARKAGR